ncbi:MAG: hypothetical protein L6U99_00915 [Clostridium sp.]|nr:MAG: hypothetical protein L6U99_00915 [Clostridium sp.]
MSFAVTAHLANKNKDNVYAIDFILNVPSSVSVVTVTSDIFDIYGIDKNNKHCFLFFFKF